MRRFILYFGGLLLHPHNDSSEGYKTLSLSTVTVYTLKEIV